MERLIRSHLASLDGYTASTPPEALARKTRISAEQVIKLDANENPYGCSPRVSQALAAHSHFNIYPDSEQTELRELLQQYTGVGVEHIVAGGGSNQLIDLLLHLFVEPGDEVLNFVPTFDMFRFSTQINGGKVVEVVRDEKYAIDVKAAKSAISSRTKLIFLASPNSPTGNMTAEDDILEIADTGLPLVIDEAYYEFSGQTVTPLLKRYKNLMVLRTFSKWAGLAGLRVGYGIFPPRIAAYLHQIKVPYNVNAAAIVAVRESLRDIDYLRDKVKLIIAERERLFGELQKLKWLKPFPSRANFIFCSVLGKASELHRQLQARGILVRYFDRPLLRDAIRISVGKPEHTDALLKALREIEAAY
ncbi:MAG: histidinol-phosphate transaminase [Chloroflexi bacterium]|nr:histidinol-phosphate transaminase [Chloroflexota bacterium]